MSAQNSVAVALIEGAAGHAQFSELAVKTPAILKLREKVGLRDDPSTPVGATEISIAMEDGEWLSLIVREPRGSEQRPLTDSDLEDKLRDLAAYGGFPRDPTPLIEAVCTLYRNLNAGDIMGLAVS